jgi:hypothetical protein
LNGALKRKSFICSESKTSLQIGKPHATEQGALEAPDRELTAIE